MTRIVAVTNCPAGIAHTYMVAEKIADESKKRGFEVHVETQGASGIENRLTSQQIAEADYVILALGKGITDEDKDRFNGKKVVEIPVSEALRNIPKIMDNLESEAKLFSSSKIKLGDKQEAVQNGLISHLMAGVSAALPFVIAGGLCMALGSIMAQFGMPNVAPKNGNIGSIAWALNELGSLGFTFMVPIMGANIAFSIGDKPAYAPAFICSLLANSPDLFGKKTGAGFIGAVLLGLAIGYFIKWFKTIKVGKTFQSTMGFLVIPFVTLLIFGLFTWWLVAPFASLLMGILLNFLNTIPPSLKLVGGFVVGAMLAFDMGGPINKAAWFFAFSLIGSHVYSWYGVVGVVTTLPPVAVAIACWIKPSLFTKQERAAALPALLVGATVATEPAIPYALAAPLPMISANTLAGAITGALTMLLGVDRIAPGINVLDPILGLVHPWYNFYICLTIGLVLNVLFIIVFKSIWIKKQKEKTIAGK
ncbi:fructose-specific PTS system IIC-like component [Lactobacillus colini]|uniref:Fructose-specific PTS system IIC-like component n=1 Tax=Lactobacillus colini TaxID=1819254 RepID=A0ABS4MFL4_9LACO|nr:fructose-specific PTS transporter subunit EIIC [Lactobacillus colini]MBP2058480.1 fructose-specific PTS system IIC-like component [Lactobacillus colini]